jgi:hypothetical protein
MMCTDTSRFTQKLSSWKWACELKARKWNKIFPQKIKKMVVLGENLPQCTLEHLSPLSTPLRKSSFTPTANAFRCFMGRVTPWDVSGRFPVIITVTFQWNWNTAWIIVREDTTVSTITVCEKEGRWMLLLLVIPRSFSVGPRSATASQLRCQTDRLLSPQFKPRNSEKYPRKLKMVFTTTALFRKHLS